MFFMGSIVPRSFSETVFSIVKKPAKIQIFLSSSHRQKMRKFLLVK